ncbi:hypothetical protein [Motiliproteus sp. SC1-56]|uniref:hypothetical protein n=1 Tax=Motiliproteus sp. SC1-56 TaxID=2799565 RepID=UPI001A8F2F51|nr:hypothetical protein [Motiliproteus sp. SC1-56]
MRCIVTFAAIIFIVSDAQGQTPINNKNCPWVSGEKSWRTYITKEVFRPKISILRIFSTSNIPDYEVWKGRCYYLEFEEERREWKVAGFYSDRKYHHESWINSSTIVNRFFDVDDQKFKQYSEVNREYGDPFLYQISVRNGRFIFNEAGEVFHSKYGLVGSLSCHMPHHTDKCRR